MADDFTSEELKKARAVGVKNGDTKLIAKIDALLSKQASAEAQPKPEAEAPSWQEALMRGGGQGVSLGLLDEISGVGGGIGTFLGGGEFGEGYTRRRDLERESNRKAEVEHPKTYLGGELGSALIPGFGLFNAAKTADKVQTVGRLMAGGGAMGAVGGFGASEEEEVWGGKGEGGLIHDTVGGALLGAVATPLLGTAAKTVGGAISGTVNALGRKIFSNPDRMSDNIIRENLVADGFNKAEDVWNEVKDRGGRLATAGPSTQGDAVVSSKMPGEGRKIANDAVNADQVGQQGRLENTIRSTISNKWDDFHGMKRTINKEREEQADALYKKAYAEEFQPSEMLLRLQNVPAIKSALVKAQEKLKNKVPSTSSEVGGAKTPTNTLELFDRAKRELGDMESKLIREGRNAEAMEIGNLRRAWTKELDDLVPSYKEARGIFAGAREMEDAADLGRKVLKDNDMFVADLDELIKDFGEGEMEALRVGMVRGMMDILESTAESGNAARKLFSSTQRKGKIDRIYPDDGGMDELINVVENENIRSGLRNQVTGGSATMERLASQERIQGNRNGELWGTITDFARRVWGREVNPENMSEQDFTMLANKLFKETSLEDIRRILSSKGALAPAETLMESPRSATLGAGAAGYLAGEQESFDVGTLF